MKRFSLCVILSLVITSVLSAANEQLIDGAPVCCPDAGIKTALVKPLFDDEARKGVACDVNKYQEATCAPQKRFFYFELGDSTFEAASKLTIDPLYGVNLRTLNSENNAHNPELDKITWPGRHTLDMGFIYTYGKKSCGFDLVKFKLGIRNRSIWGNEESVFSTAESDIRHVDARIGAHSHNITRQLFWAREAWLELSLKKLFGVSNPHALTMGIFPFSMGRGIALGDAYSTDLVFFGENSALAIDQFAPGFKMAGQLIAPCVLNYDLYAAITDNQSDTFDNVNAPIKFQQFGRRETPERGFGVLSYILAGRLQWKPWDEKGKRTSIEPYGLYVNTKELKVRYLGDATIDFGTVGLAAEFESGCWEGGFDTAVNVGGTQHFFGWDSYRVGEENRDGIDTFVTERVLDNAPDLGGIPARATGENRGCADKSPQNQKFNGEQLQNCPDLWNSRIRYLNPYNVCIRGGAMFVADAVYNFEAGVKLAATAGVATGDEVPSPAKNLAEGAGNHTFKGFIPKQDLYQGKRVRSILFFGQGKMSRGTSLIDSAVPEIDALPANIASRFSNIILTGGSAAINPTIGCNTWNLSTNIIAYWSYITVRALKDGKLFDRGRFYGTEWNFIAETEFFKDLKFFVNAALFVPGSFYGSFQEEVKKDRPSPIKTGNDTAYFVTTGFEYKF